MLDAVQFVNFKDFKNMPGRIKKTLNKQKKMTSAHAEAATRKVHRGIPHSLFDIILSSCPGRGGIIGLPAGQSY